MLIDLYGRPLLNLRISLTQRCNLRCSYCHREGEDSVGDKLSEMSIDEIVRIARVGSSLGIRGIKLTGGEPLIRKDIVKIVREIAKIETLEDISITTNGVMLADLAEELKNAGLRRVNINLPTLDESVYNKLTGGKLEDVIEGIKSAVSAGLHPVKLNMLVLRGINDTEVDEMINFASKTTGFLQLIELEQMNINKKYYENYHKSLEDYENKLKHKAIKVENRKYMQNRSVYHLPNVTIEIVGPTENTEFCKYCTRLRVTSDGKLKPCLMKNDNLVDILTPIRNGASDDELTNIFKEANLRRKPYFLI
ncbi:MAG: GTP 3',8-cyclase MoaA [Candidatus Parvarchaeota archaeon]|nr:GTP 3',8-cyclase MoaA [Candidatus Jingweiarchaeum tengchongense]MCW1298166.1 GTP 3',8-cyclase MoaA [Candidatus Jingweiarchaeum tengchongense]MCW1299964.1 GTP 3',8-cyclase MoaA [Candidatus Jingweiarchaeum tengchongense]MCW1305051.1 GTP 3',8-cyclase MoaA [Candidatus Jingweiarchaeum tengchongense]MCW1305586.1 GTP 3',8-cyclase MoaA [Candidatus Jingweiarchaeum tengchongense]